MATIDLGKIKQVFRGTYNNATAYTVDDLVSFTDTVGGLQNTSTYIAVANTTGNAPASGGTIHASWNLLAQGVPDRLPTQSGQSGKFLTTNGSALSFGTVSQPIKKVFCRQDGDRYSVNTAVVNNSYTSMYNWADMQQTITPESSSSVFSITGALHLHHYSSYEGHVAITFQIAGASEQVIASNSETDYRRTLRGSASSNGASNMQTGLPLNLMIAPATASAVTFRIRLSTSSSSYPWYVNRDGNGSTDQDDGGGILSSWTITELDGSVVTTNNFGLYIGT